MKVTILGSGSAYGTPMIFNSWGQVDPNNPKNKRLRASILIEDREKKIVVDAGPEFRLQINRNGVKNIDGVILTHAHYDHIGGISELPRASKILQRKINICASAETMRGVKESCGYLFNGEENESAGLNWITLPDCGEADVCGLKFDFFQVPHHHLKTTAFRYKNFAYITDWDGFSPKAAKKINGVDILLAECNNGMSPECNGHSSWSEITERLNGLNIKKIVLGHLSARVDYDDFKARLPKNAEPAYDGMFFEL